MSELELIATTTAGLEAVVRRELEALGYTARVQQVGRVCFAGEPSAICRANLWLRCADRVLLRMGGFEARDFGELFDRTYALPWERWIGPEAAFPVRGRSVKSQLSSVPACQKIVKKAIVEKLRAAHRTETLPETGPTCTVEVALLDDLATLTLDTTGAGLNKRGYRTLVGQAPLKETLAAAMVMLSFWRPERALIDPFCGAGTIPIEAAMIGLNMAPGLNRSFAAEDWPALSASLWQGARAEARDLARPDTQLTITGFDIDAEEISLARYHAKQAGVDGHVHFQAQPFADLSSARQYGCVICNPPYGERLSHSDEVEALYRSIPPVLSRLETWSHYVLTARRDFEKLVGRPADRRRKLYNGRIECTYYQFHGPKMGSTAAQPQVEPAGESPAVFDAVSKQARLQADALAGRLRKRARHLRRWPKRGITCYRLYDHEVAEIPLAVDFYDGRLRLAELAAPHRRSPAEQANWLDVMARTAAEALDVPTDDVFLVRRQDQARAESSERDERGAFTVTEGELKFRVDLSAADTGLALDLRVLRSMVREASAGKRMLTLFARAGALSVYAAAGGAESTTSVDASDACLDWARENMAANGFTGPAHTFVRSGALAFLRQREPASAWDLAVVVASTAEADWDIRRDHGELLSLLTKRLSPGGMIYFAADAAGFELDESAAPGRNTACEQAVPPAKSAAPGLAIREITKQIAPEDFPNKPPRRCWRLTR